MKSSKILTAVLPNLILMVLIFPAMALATLPENEEHLWQLAAAQQADNEQRCTLLNDPALAGSLEAVLGQLWPHVQTTLPPMTLKVIQDPYPNAFTYPNGVCYLTTGMLVHLRNEDQLAMVLAHEIVHYVSRHALGALGHFKLVHAETGQGPQRTSAARMRQPPANLTKYREEVEKQADREGLVLLELAGFEPDNVVALLNGFQCGRDEQAPKPAFAHRFEGSRDRRLIAASITAQDKDHIGKVNSCDYDRSYLLQVLPALLADARACLRLGLWDQAQKDLSGYMAACTDDPQAYFLQGELRRQGSTGGEKSQAAIRSYRAAIRLDQKFAPAYRELGVVHFKLGQRKEARQFFETYLTLAPQGEGSDYIRGYLKLCAN